MQVYTTYDRIQANYLMSELQEHNIYVVIFEKRAHPYAGDALPVQFELYVHDKQAEEALEIIYNLPE